MKAVYEYPIPKGKLVLLGVVALLYPAYTFLRMAWDTGRDAFIPGQPWWATVIYIAALLLLGFFFLWLNRGNFRRARLELEDGRLTIHFGAGIQHPGMLGGTKFTGESLVLDLSSAHLEWAGQALNFRNRAYGTLTLAYGDAARSVADWLSANGHPPVRAY